MRYAYYIAIVFFGGIGAVTLLQRSIPEVSHVAVVTHTIDAVNANNLNAGQACVTPMNIDYMDSLQGQEHADVHFAGCGGLI